MLGPSKNLPKSWLAFDLNVLRRLKFSSAALPFTDQPALGCYLKRWQVRVAANDPLQSAWTRGNVQIANNRQRFSAAEVNAVLTDAYVPGYRYQNPGLTAWFNETDSWWFDNVRRNIDTLSAPMSRLIAASIVFSVGDYALSFKEETRELRQPLSNVFRRMWSIQPEPFENHENNTCDNKNVDSFIAETPADLMFLRLPAPHAQGMRSHLGRSAWREEWIRGGNEFWDELEFDMKGRLGSPTETKSQYLHLLDETLRRATHIANWAIAHVETGFIQTQDIVDVIASTRRVDTIYTKDFTELMGTKAVIITA